MEFIKKKSVFCQILSHCLHLGESHSSLLLIQDTAGSERYEAMSRIYYRGARAAIVCYGKSIKFQIILERASMWHNYIAD